jgi:hypothetical protein
MAVPDVDPHAAAAPEPNHTVSAPAASPPLASSSREEAVSLLTADPAVVFCIAQRTHLPCRCTHLDLLCGELTHLQHQNMAMATRSSAIATPTRPRTSGLMLPYTKAKAKARTLRPLSTRPRTSRQMLWRTRIKARSRPPPPHPTRPMVMSTSSNHSTACRLHLLQHLDKRRSQFSSLADLQGHERTCLPTGNLFPLTCLERSSCLQRAPSGCLVYATTMST